MANWAIITIKLSPPWMVNIAHVNVGSKDCYSDGYCSKFHRHQLCAPRSLWFALKQLGRLNFSTLYPISVILKFHIASTNWLLTLPVNQTDLSSLNYWSISESRNMCCFAQSESFKVFSPYDQLVKVSPFKQHNYSTIQSRAAIRPQAFEPPETVLRTDPQWRRCEFRWVSWSD